MDATLGLGGHSELILEGDTNIRVIGIDQDEAAIEGARRLKRFESRILAVHGNFSKVSEIIENAKLGQPDAIVADLGVSSMQFDDAESGFSFRFDAPLDMRMDASSGGPTAADLLETLSRTELANIIYDSARKRLATHRKMDRRMK